MDAIPLPSKSDDQISKALPTLILRHGASHDSVHCSVRPKFMGPIITSISKKLKINTVRKSAYNAQANIAERNHREIAVKMRLSENNGSKNWSDKVSLILFYFNVSGRPLYLPITSAK